MPDFNLPLLLLQAACFFTTTILAMVLLMSRVHLRQVSSGYETSRWLLIASLSLFSVHYLLQMMFGFRARGEDVGALVNILFYMPAAFLMVCATLRISTGQRYLRRFFWVGMIGIIAMLGVFAVGLVYYGSLRMPWALRIMEVLYVGMIIFCIVHPESEVQRMLRKIEDETADDNTRYYLYMRSGTLLLYAMGLIGALAILRTKALFVMAILFLLVLGFYVVSFVSLGFSMQALSSIMDDDDNSEPLQPEVQSGEPHLTAGTEARLSPEQVQQIADAIADWRVKQGYSISSLNSVTMAQSLGISKRLLTQYLAEHEGTTFRVWLSNLRIEEAKRRLLTDTDYSIEAIAEACGFSSRSWMQEKFKSSTGMTPAEWRDTQKG